MHRTALLMPLLLLFSSGAPGRAQATLPGKGPYFGQELPQERPVLFAPGWVSVDGRVEERVALSPDGKECFFNVTTLAYKGFALHHTRQNARGEWTAPTVAAFATGTYDYGSPAFSPDGRKLYFVSNRPYPGQVAPVCRSIWYTSREADGWSEPRFLSKVFALPEDLSYVSVTASGTIYFIGYNRSADGHTIRTLYRSKTTDGEYRSPENLNAALHSEGAELHDPFIAADESLLLFNRNEVKSVCFRRADGSWTEPVAIEDRLAAVSGKKWAMSLSPDMRYLFFSNWPPSPDPRTHVYWISAGFLQALRPRN